MELREGCRCQVCSRMFRVDVLVSDELWGRIRPDGRAGGGGLLCGACIIARLDEALSFSAFELRAM